jgi:hypothetical protein
MQSKTTIEMALLMLLAVAASGCVDEDVGSYDSPAIVTSFESFGATAMGDTQRRILTVRNDGEGTLRLTRIEFTEARDDQNRELRPDGWSPGDLSIRIDKGESRAFSIAYTPRDTTPDRGEVRIHTNDPANAIVTVSMRPPAPAPEIFPTPSSVVYQGVDPSAHDADWPGEPRLVELQNVGEAPLHVSQIFVADSDAFEVAFPQPSTDQNGEVVYVPEDDRADGGWPSALEPGESFPVRVRFRPVDRLPKNGVLVIKSDDADTPRLEVPLSGNSGAACLETNVEQVAFGQSSIGAVTQKTVTIGNCSRSESLEISRIAMSDDAAGVFAVDEDSLPDELDTGSLTIPPLERRNVVVTFTPDTSESYRGELVIESNDPTGPRALSVTGTGTDNECPTARATATTPGSSRPQAQLSARPLDTITFDGTGSTDPDGDDAQLSYEWTILSRPQGSTQQFSPSPHAEEPRLFLDLAGVYEIELKVYDEDGAVSCGEPAIVTVDTFPDGDVHIQLVWDTPADTDQTDDVGSDLDLHYLHPHGQWDNEPWDVFWRNKAPDWGVTGDTSDDPALDIDDTNGAGPENINHSNLEGLVYQAGVHYYSDRGFGASYATVRVYIGGVLAMELENKYMPESGAFWRVGFVEAPSLNVQSINRLYNGFPGN